MRPAAVVIAMVGSVHPAFANTPVHLQCGPVADGDAAAATALCNAFATALEQSGWAKRQTAVTLQLAVNNIRPTALNVTLTLTNPNGGSHAINRALSVSDAAITPAMQDAFLQKLISAIPADF